MFASQQHFWQSMDPAAVVTGRDEIRPAPPPRTTYRTTCLETTDSSPLTLPRPGG